MKMALLVALALAVGATRAAPLADNTDPSCLDRAVAAKEAVVQAQAEYDAAFASLQRATADLATVEAKCRGKTGEGSVTVAVKAASDRPPKWAQQAGGLSRRRRVDTSSEGPAHSLTQRPHRQVAPRLLSLQSDGGPFPTAHPLQARTPTRRTVPWTIRHCEMRSSSG